MDGEHTGDLRRCIEDDDDDWCFTATFVHKVSLMGLAAPKGNETKSRMKQICLCRDSNTDGSDLCSNTLPLNHGGARMHAQKKDSAIWKKRLSIVSQESLTSCALYNNAELNSDSYFFYL